jgi:FPC/CPF motif-containing protein YcgG
VESQFCVNAKKEYDKVYGETKDRTKFVERLQQTINERLNAVARQQIEANLQATPTVLE